MAGQPATPKHLIEAADRHGAVVILGAFYQFGRVNYADTYLNDFSVIRLGRATDVVTGPNGQPTCRSVLTGEDPNCVPWDIWARNSVDPARDVRPSRGEGRVALQAPNQPPEPEPRQIRIALANGRLDPRLVGKRVLESLIMAGALDGFGHDRAVLHAEIPDGPLVRGTAHVPAVQRAAVEQGGEPGGYRRRPPGGGAREEQWQRSRRGPAERSHGVPPGPRTNSMDRSSISASLIAARGFRNTR